MAVRDSHREGEGHLETPEKLKQWGTWDAEGTVLCSIWTVLTAPPQKKNYEQNMAGPMIHK